MTRPGTRRTFWVSTGFYLLILLEFVYMASPFAVYCYAVYGPGLRALAANPVLARLSGAFLPHIAEQTANPLLDLHNLVGAGLTAAGLLGFLVSAVHVYHHKLFRRGAVLGGMYRLVRHPQYASLILAGFGFVLLWPRYLVLLSFVTMLFAYHALARLEERECLARFGSAYRDYLDRTRRYLPFGPRRRPPTTTKRPEPARVRRIATFAVRYAGATVVALGLALALNQLSLRAIYARYSSTDVYLSVTRLDAETLDRVSRIASACPEATAAIRGAGAEARFINYVLPADWYVSETLMAPRAGGGHLVPATAHGQRYRVVFTQAQLTRPATGPAILRYTAGRSPVLEVVVDLAANSVVEVVPPFAEHPYNGIPVPVY